MKRALLKKSVANFLSNDCETLSKLLVGELVSNGFSGEKATLQSYHDSFKILQKALTETIKVHPAASDWWLFFEFQLPRRQKRLDLIILAGDRLIIGEFKTGEGMAGRQAEIQVEDYALDLRDFHETSNHRLIVPLVIGNSHTPGSAEFKLSGGSAITGTVTVQSSQLASAITEICKVPHPFDHTNLDPVSWEQGSYSPVPPILEAALYLYRNHSVKEIASCSAELENLTSTVDAIRDVVEFATRKNCRAVCFVTGVPGSGKTLAGLSAVHAHSDQKGELPAATFLSGNIPLVKVLREALIRDAKSKDKQSRAEATRHVHTFVESMQAFITEHGLTDITKPPSNKVIVFDEAQRAWDRAQMLKKKSVDHSEPSLILEIMGRHENAVIIALVGGGQEIHSGEAGLKGWGDALEADPRWSVFASPEVIEGSSSVGGSKLFENGIPASLTVTEHKDLHLSVNLRTHQGRHWNEWVEAFLRSDQETSLAVAGALEKFEVRITRDLEAARSWARSRHLGSKRRGLVSSSGNLRARAYGIEVSSSFKSGINWPSWFLNNEDDIRSSSFLEVAATEFECQGLELDDVVLCWGGDFLSDFSDTWKYSSFSGSKWKAVKKTIVQRFILSKYRVLLTRARSGLVIWVPEGIETDPSTKWTEFDLLYERLQRFGLKPL